MAFFSKWNLELEITWNFFDAFSNYSIINVSYLFKKEFIWIGWKKYALPCLIRILHLSEKPISFYDFLCKVKIGNHRSFTSLEIVFGLTSRYVSERLPWACILHCFPIWESYLANHRNWIDLAHILSSILLPYVFNDQRPRIFVIMCHLKGSNVNNSIIQTWVIVTADFF